MLSFLSAGPAKKSDRQLESAIGGGPAKRIDPGAKAPQYRRMRRLSNYSDYLITTSVSALAGKAFEASFVVSRRSAGSEEHVIHTASLARTFAFEEEARSAATQAAHAYVDGLKPRPQGARFPSL